MRQVLSEAGESAGHPLAMPSPTGGWNARDNLSRMRDTDAIYLDNWFPTATSVDIRPGNLSAATLPAGKVIQSLLNCAKKDGTAKRFAVAQDGVYDITPGGAIAAAVYALTNAKVESLNINVAGEPWLWCCNAVDKSFLYKSSTNAFQVIDNASVPVLTGITSTDVTNVSMWKNRVILCQKDSLSFWYLPLNSVGGAAVQFDLGQIFRKGGYLVATANWSVDAGDGPDDRFVAISSEGEIAVYQGTDPSAITTFNLIGVYFVGKPIGKRCLVQIGSDLAVLTEQGLWPLSKALQSATIDRKQALTDKIGQAFNAYYKLYGTNYGWQPILFPQGPALLVNVPLTATVSYQVVMNTITGAWCRFTNWNAQCWMVSEGNLYSAVGATVKQNWAGTSDTGAAIIGMVKQSFTYGPGRTRGRTQHIKLVRPILTAPASLTVQMALDTNFADGHILSSAVNFIQNLTRWDTARFDQSYWSAGDVTTTSWRTVAHKPGKVFSLRMRCSVKDIPVSWSAVDFICEPGGLLG